MSQMFVPHFEESGRTNPVAADDRLSAKDFAIALDHLVITCVDLALVHRDRILLAQRNQYPRKSWWLIGGRMIAGETPLQAAQRKAQEEANLSHLAPDRFQYLGAYSTCFARRSQPPQSHGLHSVNLTYQLSLTDAEISQIQLIQTEYEPTHEWIRLDQVKPFLTPQDALDQALLAVVLAIKPTTEKPEFLR
jgi:ADP-ribose pyrophosphatase YjhB (NUDIX family)